MKKYNNERVLVISDLHCPYHHKDTLVFLKAVKSEYDPDRVLSTGDEADHHAISYHDHDPDLLSPGNELAAASKALRQIEELFPRMDILDSNHGSLYYRKAKTNGIPKHAIKPYNELLGVGKGWKWHTDLTLTMSNGKQVYFHHSRGSNILQVSQKMGMSVVAGHLHTKLSIQYWANPNDLYFAMQLPCMIDDKSLAYAYNKLPVERPLVACGIIIDGHPRLLPMVLNKAGRWNNRLV